MSVGDLKLSSTASMGKSLGQSQLQNSCPPPQRKPQQKFDMPSQKFGKMAEKSGDAYKSQKYNRKKGDFAFGKIDGPRMPCIFDDE